jgi:hypothetical protein
VRSRLLDLRAQLLDAALDIGLLAGTVDNRGVVLVDHDPLGPAEILQCYAFELDAELFRDHLATAQDGDILEHRPAPISEAGRLDRGARERAAELVHHQRRQGLAVDVLGHQQERLASLRNRLENRQQVLHLRASKRRVDGFKPPSARSCRW